MFILRMGNDDGGVEVEHQLARQVWLPPQPSTPTPALARPADTIGSWSSETLSGARQAVGPEATRPNRPRWSRSTFKPMIEVAPSSDGHGKVRQHLSGEVERQRGVGTFEGLVPGTHQPGRPRQLPQQLAAGMEGHPRALSSCHF